MPYSKTPVAVLADLWRQQFGLCPWCLQFFPLERAIPHHWLFKRGPLPDSVVHHPNNIVAIDQECHDLYGQTKQMAIVCLELKELAGCDIYGWVIKLIEDGQVVTWPQALPKQRLEESHEPS
jgi:hypothetical protein